jgi:hypothetical protein
MDDSRIYNNFVHFVHAFSIRVKLVLRGLSYSDFRIHYHKQGYIYKCDTYCCRIVVRQCVDATQHRSVAFTYSFFTLRFKNPIDHCGYRKIMQT